MAKSLYKARGMGSRPPCAICMGPGSGDRAPLHLPFGLTVWLCAEHRSAEFLTRRAGRDLVVSLSGVWDAAGCMTAARRRVLAGHQERALGERAHPGRPGSYAWPALRREAEARFAGGEPPPLVIAELRSRHANDPARVPSIRTMQRWFAQARWLAGGQETTGPAGRQGPSARPADTVSETPTVQVQGRHDHGGTEATC